PKGFTLEVLVANFQDADAPTYAEAFINFLQNLINNCGSLLRLGIFPQIPDPGLQGEYIKLTFEPDEAKLFAEIVEESLATARNALAAETYGESARLWREVFGNRFPDAPTAMKSLRIEEMVEDEDIFDPMIEAEISDIELPPLSDPVGKLKLKAGLATK